MKSFLRSIVRNVVKNKYGWYLLKPLVDVGEYIDFQKNKAPYYKNVNIQAQKFKKLLETPVVKNGPFKGLVYPEFESYGSTIFPKIIGSYEYELQSYIDDLSTKIYSKILDIGSAEGYYAIGFAKKLPSAKILAFDIDPKANDFCSRMARLNNVEERITIHSVCNEKTLLELDFGIRSLIICDCEGFEKDLFTAKNIDNLKHCDLIIETHDFIDINISTYLEQLFSKTHTIKKIKSIDDIDKAKTYDFPILNILTLEEKREILKESRPSLMEWFICEPKIEKFK